MPIIDLDSISFGEEPLANGPNHDLDVWSRRIDKLVEANRWSLGFVTDLLALSSAPAHLRGIRAPDDQETTTSPAPSARTSRSPALSIQSLIRLAESVGFSSSTTVPGLPYTQVEVAVAVALAESSGVPDAYNPKGKDRSHGLWQINMIGKLGPARQKRFKLSPPVGGLYLDLFNPTINAKAAYSISGGGKNWGPWGAFTNGSWRKHINNVTRVTRGR